MKIRTVINIFILLFIVYNVAINFSAIKTFYSTNSDEISGKIAEIAGKAQKARTPVIEEAGNTEAYFCPRDDCEGRTLAFMQGARQQIHCALFDLDLPEMIQFFDDQSAVLDVKIVIDNENYRDVAGKPYVRKDTKSQLSHNKFCVVDNRKVWTGSFNPTNNDNNKNNNNVVLITSEALAANYETEFQELWNGKFGQGERTKNSFIKLNGTILENYFCPEDWCANKIIFAINEAKQSVIFMTFSFTHDGIGNVTRKKAIDGLDVRGVFETSQSNDFTEYTEMSAQGMDVKWDGNPKNMHHKVFIIDNKTVITGSFNPSRNGDQVNDENVLVIHDEVIAKKYLEEFEYVWSQTRASQ
ncbi:hypothetical protein HY772_07930 [Candidatus Woesearchaeota archaeon]|nr:hypothetical protein [Candidatus Woesearchaeota archaeon]